MASPAPSPSPRQLVATCEQETLIKVRTSKPLSEAQKRELMNFLARSLALAGNVSVEIL